MVNRRDRISQAVEAMKLDLTTADGQARSFALSAVTKFMHGATKVKLVEKKL